MNTNNPSSANTPSQPTSESNEPGNVPQGSTGRKRKAPTDEGNVTQDSAQKRRAPPKTNTTKGKKPVSRTKRGLRPRMEMTQAEKDAEYMETGIAKDVSI